MPATTEYESSGTAPRGRLFWMTWSMAAAFGTYFCMYAFRKPFTVATYQDVTAWGWDFKVLLVSAQVIGYMLSKFIGIKVIAEMPPQRRAMGILMLILSAQAALVLFGLTPRPWSAVWLFANGLPLGMVFGLVLGFLEGRQLTEAMTAGLCASFILADGATKSVGAWLLVQGVSETWMPAAAGLLFLPPLGIGVAMLSRIPPPAAADVVARAARTPMTRDERWELFARHALGLTLLVTMYLAVTIVRSMRADFAPEIWRGLGTTVQPSTFSYSEIVVALGVLVVNGMFVFVMDNRRAFFASLAVCTGGFLMIAAALAGNQTHRIDGFTFMVLLGLGLYLPYVAMHTTIFERLLAMTRERGNLGFLMYVADAFGYLGYVGVLVVRNFATTGDDVLLFFVPLCWIATIVSLACLLGSWRYFASRPRAASAEIASVPA